MKRKIDYENILLFDGAMGTLLQSYGLKTGQPPESYNILGQELIAQIHGEYLQAGADIITTNTFGANSLKLSQYGLSVKEIVTSGVNIARQAAKDKLVALDIGPLGQFIEPYGTLSFDEAYLLFKEQVIFGAKAGADLILIETMTDLYELKVAVLAATENSNLPVFATMTFQADGKTLMGTDPLTMVNTISGLGVKALGINCSLGPIETLPLLEEIVKYAKVPVIARPNAGLPKENQGETVFEIGPEEFASFAKQMVQKGVSIIGGCCGTNPKYIQALKELKTVKPLKRQIQKLTAVSSATKTVIIGEKPAVIGERLNPTGKRYLQEALSQKDFSVLLQEAIKQKEAGADLLDVNVGLPEIDEAKTMAEVIKQLQGIIDLPLSIDSMNRDVLEAAVRVYNGKPLINSVNGKDDVMAELFPLVKKYGACAVCLTLDEKGIPPTAEKRLEIAKRIVNKAAQYGIDKEDLIMDCLVLTASTEQSQIPETLRAISLIKKELGVKTVLGISNVSFGLPDRTLLNKTFLALALGAGLDAAIIDPLDAEMMATLDACNVLLAFDINANRFLTKYSSIKKQDPQAQITEEDLKKVIGCGLKAAASGVTKNLLKKLTPLQVIDQYIIPALDEVGLKYEKGELYLPHLIQAAETTRVAFEVIKTHNLEEKKASLDLNKGKIALATVEGDIHDIGKNMVKLLLENYGFKVIDLGRDVSQQVILKTVREEKIELLGLSALMTTTVKNMEKTIAAIRKEGLDCKVMVGGAVLNKEYASLIGADYYGRDAREAVKIAREFFKKN